MINKVDIAICTWNRSRLLEQTLASVGRLMVPENISLTIVVVDNNSSDNTQVVIQRFADSEFGKKHEVLSLKEMQQGHTFSRNRAISAANGDLLMWTDDDVSVSPEWIQKYVDAANSRPEIGFFGSVIEPKFESGQPRWITENWEELKGCFAHRDLGDVSVAFTSTMLPYGANFAIRTDLQQRFLFNQELGRRGDEVLGEDELDLLRRLIAEGHQGCWIPGAVVDHFIPVDRSTESYVYDYFVGQGRALVAKGKPWHDNIPELTKEWRSNYVWYKFKRRFASSKVWVSHMLRSALAKGQAEALTKK